MVKRALLLLVLLVPLASGCSSANTASGEESDATVTPIAGRATSTPPPPTSTRAPLPTPDATLSEDFLEGQQQLADENFERAVAAFRRALRSTPNNEQVRTELAETYLAWGRDIVSHSEAKPERLSDAVDKFVSGSRIAVEGSETHESLQWEQGATQLYLQALLDFQGLEGLGAEGASLTAQQEHAGNALSMFADAYEQNPHLPGLRLSYADALIITAGIYEDLGDEQESREAALPHWEGAQSLCKQSQEVAGTENPASECVERVANKITPPPTPTPAPPPTDSGSTSHDSNSGQQPQTQYVQIPDVRGADVGQAQAYLQGLGFAVAITELPADQARGLCAGVVSYSSPPKGRYVPAGSFVRLFYRSYNQHGCS
jgi:hypothetical protein